MTHLQIGKKLLAQTTHHANDNLQTILHHLNMGLKMMTSDDEKLKQEASSTQHICMTREITEQYTVPQYVN